MLMKIRDASPEDIPAMFSLSSRVHHLPPYDTLIPVDHRERFLHAYTPGSRFEVRLSNRILRFINTPGHYAYIAEIDGRVVGYRLAEHSQNHVYLHGLFVDPDYQGRGIGRALLKVPLLIAQPHDTIHLVVLRGNTRARHLYESEGFRYVGDSPVTFYGAVQEEMVLTIDAITH